MAAATLIAGGKGGVQDLSDKLVYEFTLDELQKLVKQLTSQKAPTKKQEAADYLANFLCGTDLEKLLSTLEEVERLALAEALYSEHGYDPERFKANYGKTVSFGQRSGYHSQPKLLRAFLAYTNGNVYKVRQPLREKLLKFVPPPKPPNVATVERLPEFYEYKTTDYEWQEDDPGKTLFMRNAVYRMPSKEPKSRIHIEQLPIATVERAALAQQELWSVLRLAQEGKLTVTEKSRQPSQDILFSISRALDGDYYQEHDSETFREISFIRSFAWPMLVQAAGLAMPSGKKLVLSKTGLTALAAEPAKLIKSIWASWLATGMFDEFRRIDCIKGQTGKAQRAMTDPSGRRRQIAKTLASCPSNAWIGFDEFSRYMRAIGNRFEVTNDAWPLYICDAKYGSLGYGHSWTWEILQDRYMLCFLFEYAATLGLIDVAFVEPQSCRKNYEDLWGTDDLAFLSRYDGLLYFRVNALGDFCLDKVKSYKQSISGSAAALSVRPNKRIELTKGSLSMANSLLLESFAEPLGNGAWELSMERSLIACENGQNIEDLKRLLQSLDDQQMPEKVESFFAKVSERAHAVRCLGNAVLFECMDGKAAKEIASHPTMKNLCQLTSNNQLVVKKCDESKFRKTLHVIGYGTGAPS